MLKIQIPGFQIPKGIVRLFFSSPFLSPSPLPPLPPPFPPPPPSSSHCIDTNDICSKESLGNFSLFDFVQHCHFESL